MVETQKLRKRSYVGVGRLTREYRINRRRVGKRALEQVVDSFLGNAVVLANANRAWRIAAPCGSISCLVFSS